KHDIVQELVAAEDAFGIAVAIGPGPELFENPRRLPARRVGKTVTDRLRPGRLLLRVARIPVVVIFGPLQRLRLHGSRLRDRIGLRPNREGDVYARPVVAILRTKRGGDRRAPIATLRAVTTVAEPVHQARPRPCDAVDTPAGGRRFGREAKA